MRQRVLQAFGAAAVLALAVAACSEEPSLFLGGPPGPDARHKLSSSTLTLVVGDSVIVGARTEDEVGNVTGTTPSMSACSGEAALGASETGGIYTTSMWVRGVSLGETCLVVSSGSIVDTVRVTVGPAAVAIVGEPIIGYNSEDPTENIFEYALEPVDVAGNPLTGTIPSLSWASSDPDLFAVDPTGGTVTTKGLGSATLSVRAPGGANDVQTLTVYAPLLDGSASAVTGGQGDIITLTRAGGPVFDSNTEAYVNFGGVRAFVDGAITADQMSLAVPATGVLPARSDIVIRKVGPNDVDRRVVFEATTGGTGHRHAPASNTCAAAPDFDAQKSAGNWIYFSFTSASAGYGGANPDVWFKAEGGAAGRTVTARFEWMSPSGGTTYADADLFAYIGCGTAAIAASQNYNPPEPPLEELAGLVIPPGQTLYVRAVIFAAQGASFSNARIRIQ